MNKIHKILYWFPRVLSILFIAFLSLFALDVFGEYGFPEVLLALFMHLIPNFVLIGILLIAWKWEQVGGLLFIGLGAIACVVFKGDQDLIWYLLIPGPPFLIGILFVIQQYVKK